MLTPLNLKWRPFGELCAKQKGAEPEAPLDILRPHSLNIKESYTLDKEVNFQRRPFNTRLEQPRLH